MPWRCAVHGCQTLSQCEGSSRRRPQIAERQAARTCGLCTGFGRQAQAAPVCSHLHALSAASTVLGLGVAALELGVCSAGPRHARLLSGSGATGRGAGSLQRLQHVHAQLLAAPQWREGGLFDGRQLWPLPRPTHSKQGSHSRAPRRALRRAGPCRCCKCTGRTLRCRCCRWGLRRGTARCPCTCTGPQCTAGRRRQGRRGRWCRTCRLARDGEQTMWVLARHTWWEAGQEERCRQGRLCSAV